LGIADAIAARATRRLALGRLCQGPIYAEARPTCPAAPL
jgi:hypothetical protein